MTKIRGRRAADAARTPAQKRARRDRERRRRQAAQAPQQPGGVHHTGTNTTRPASGGADPAKFPAKTLQEAAGAKGPRTTIAEASALGLLDDQIGSANGAAAQAAKVESVYPGIAKGVRNVVFEMLKDGTLLTGLECAVDQRAHDRRYRGTERDDRGDVGGSSAGRAPQPAPPTPKSRRFENFIELLDQEFVQTMNLISGLETRLAFLTYDGPAEATETRGDAAQTGRPTPGNVLEETLNDRVQRASLIRHRLEQLHSALRT